MQNNAYIVVNNTKRRISVLLVLQESLVKFFTEFKQILTNYHKSNSNAVSPSESYLAVVIKNVKICVNIIVDASKFNAKLRYVTW